MTAVYFALTPNSRLNNNACKQIYLTSCCVFYVNICSLECHGNKPAASGLIVKETWDVVSRSVEGHLTLVLWFFQFVNALPWNRCNSDKLRFSFLLTERGFLHACYFNRFGPRNWWLHKLFHNAISITSNRRIISNDAWNQIAYNV